MNEHLLYFLAGIGATIIIEVVLAGLVYLFLQIAAWRGYG